MESLKKTASERDEPDEMEWESEIQLESQNSYPSYNIDTYEEDPNAGKRVSPIIPFFPHNRSGGSSSESEFHLL